MNRKYRERISLWRTQKRTIQFAVIIRRMPQKKRSRNRIFVVSIGPLGNTLLFLRRSPLLPVTITLKAYSNNNASNVMRCNVINAYDMLGRVTASDSIRLCLVGSFIHIRIVSEYGWGKTIGKYFVWKVPSGLATSPQ